MSEKINPEQRYRHVKIHSAFGEQQAVDFKLSNYNLEQEIHI